jgi:hypothetical protein
MINSSNVKFGYNSKIIKELTKNKLKQYIEIHNKAFLLRTNTKKQNKAALCQLIQKIVYILLLALILSIKEQV